MVFNRSEEGGTKSRAIAKPKRDCFPSLLEEGGVPWTGKEGRGLLLWGSPEGEGGTQPHTLKTG